MIKISEDLFLDPSRVVAIRGLADGLHVYFKDCEHPIYVEHQTPENVVALMELGRETKQHGQRTTAIIAEEADGTIMMSIVVDGTQHDKGRFLNGEDLAQWVLVNKDRLPDGLAADIVASYS